MRSRVPIASRERASSGWESIARAEFRAGDVRQAIADAIENHVRVRQSAGVLALARALVLLDEDAPRAVRPLRIGVATRHEIIRSAKIVRQQRARALDHFLLGQRRRI